MLIKDYHIESILKRYEEPYRIDRVNSSLVYIGFKDEDSGKYHLRRLAKEGTEIEELFAGDSEGDFSFDWADRLTEFPAWSGTPQTVRYLDIDGQSYTDLSRGDSVGGTAQDFYNATGCGSLHGFVMSLEDADKNWLITVTLDGEDVMNEFSTEDLHEDDRYNYKDEPPFLGWSVVDGKTVKFECVKPLEYFESVLVTLRKTGGSKDFEAGFIIIEEG